MTTTAINLEITASFGAAQFNNDRSHELIKRADDLLYQAKEKGKDRVETENF